MMYYKIICVVTCFHFILILLWYIPLRYLFVQHRDYHFIKIYRKITLVFIKIFLIQETESNESRYTLCFSARNYVRITIWHNYVKSLLAFGRKKKLMYSNYRLDSSVKSWFLATVSGSSHCACLKKKNRKKIHLYKNVLS